MHPPRPLHPVLGLLASAVADDAERSEHDTLPASVQKSEGFLAAKACFLGRKVFSSVRSIADTRQNPREDNEVFHFDIVAG